MQKIIAEVINYYIIIFFLFTYEFLYLSIEIYKTGLFHISQIQHLTEDDYLIKQMSEFLQNLNFQKQL